MSPFSAPEFLDKLKDNKTIKTIRSHLPPLNFITVHYAYFIFTCLLFSVIFWGCSDPSKSITYTDSLFLVVSAMTEAGLNTVNLSQMTTGQQFILWLLILIGSSIFVSIGTVLTRKRVFEMRFESMVKLQKDLKRMERRSMSENKDFSANTRLGFRRKSIEPEDHLGFESRHGGPRDPTNGEADPGAEKRSDPAVKEGKVDSTDSTENGKIEGMNGIAVEDHASGDPDHIRYAPSPDMERPNHRRILSFTSVSGHHNTSTAYKPPYMTGNTLTNRAKKEAQHLSHESGLDHLEYPHYLTRHTTGRNAQFFGLSKAEREHLGGVEYRAITLLAWVVPIYFVLWQLLGCLGLAAYMAHNKASTARENGIDPWWLGIFNGVSAFNNSGMSLLDANMIPFQTSVYTLMTMSLMILAGNTAYPLFLRLILWTMLKVLCYLYPNPAHHSANKATLRFILTYPRRVYTNLFPSAPTWWLLFMVVILNGIDWAAFELLNIGNAAVQSIPRHFRVLDGLFQAFAVRSGGFYVISITSLRIGLQVLYVIMMYISVYPVVITMRHSNVYEERSLGIYSDESPSDSTSTSTSKDDVEQGPKLGKLAGKLRRTLTTTFLPDDFIPAPKRQQEMSTGRDFVRQQVRGQLAHDLWWLVLAILFISCIEVANFERDPVTYSVFNIAFEVVSGYGCVGISTGVPNDAYSFSGGWHKASKLILCAVMLRGRHRGLPVAIDRAVRLPGGVKRELGREEEEDAELRRTMSIRRLSFGPNLERAAKLPGR